MRIAAAAACVLTIAACTGTPAQPSPTDRPSPSATLAPTQATSPAPTVTPTPPATPSATATAATNTTPFDGLWASEPLTKELMDAALTRSGLDPNDFHPWFEDWTGIDHRTFTVRIKNGVWRESDFSDGVWDGDWTGKFTVNGSTLVIHDDGVACDIPFDLVRSGDLLLIQLGAATCGTDDVLLETAIYEASPFHLIQAADWQPPDWSPPSPPSPRPTRGPSTSDQRVVARPTGTVDGAPLGYLEYLPPSYSDGGAPSPLLLFFHGSGESGTGDLADLGRLSISAIPGLLTNSIWPDSRPFVVLAPQHDEQPPSYCMEATEIHDFIAFALDHYNVDPTRIYATGLSCGAIGLWNYLTQHGDESLAAAIPIAGNGIVAFQVRGCSLATLPIWAFHGASDPNVPISGSVYPLTQLQACTDPAPTDARLTVFPDSGHDVWTRTYDGSDNYDIYGWLLSHRKGG